MTTVAMLLTPTSHVRGVLRENTPRLGRAAGCRDGLRM